VKGDCQTVLEGIETEILGAAPGTAGFVLDADSPIKDRWRAVSDRLKKVRLEPPPAPVPTGYIDTLDTLGLRVGVWLMPDNQHDGKLETFLQELIVSDDKLIQHARTATTAASEISQRFSDPDRIKAELHTWLAWQQEPGCRYGTAIRAKYFQHDTPAANAFVEWFRTLYELEARAPNSTMSAAGDLASDRTKPTTSE
jgi:hypothetical protein